MIGCLFSSFFDWLIILTAYRWLAVHYLPSVIGCSWSSFFRDWLFIILFIIFILSVIGCMPSLLFFSRFRELPFDFVLTLGIRSEFYILNLIQNLKSSLKRVNMFFGGERKEYRLLKAILSCCPVFWLVMYHSCVVDWLCLYPALLVDWLPALIACKSLANYLRFYSLASPHRWL